MSYLGGATDYLIVYTDLVVALGILVLCIQGLIAGPWMEDSKIA
jgi:hypothetical protein